jgi:membrane-associated phospholipid phosphatase
VQGPLPGDVAATLALQSAFGASKGWAEWLTDTAKPPLVVATIIFGAGLASLVAGWRAALAVPLAFGFSWTIDKVLRAVIFSPRPSPDLVEIASASGSSGLPSTFGLAYGSIFGAALLAASDGRIALAARALALALIIAGAAARVALGGHWTSQMITSSLLGFLAAIAATAVLRRVGDRGLAKFR